MKSTVSIVLLFAVLVAGCSNAKQGAVSGAGVGALSGLVIGSMTGSAGKGAAIGAVVGGVGGAVIGNQNKKKSDAAAAAAAQTPPSAPPAAPATAVAKGDYQTGQALSRLVGVWKIAGTTNGADGQSVPITGTAKATVDKTYFLRMDILFTDPRDGKTVDGTSVISQRGGKAVDMTNSFSSSPEVKQFRGEMDDSGTVFNFAQIDPPHSSRRVIIRASNSAQWTADVWDGNKRVESYTFTPGN